MQSGDSCGNITAFLCGLSILLTRYASMICVILRGGVQLAVVVN
jgi:hypothetical protein